MASALATRRALCAAAAVAAVVALLLLPPARAQLGPWIGGGGGAGGGSGASLDDMATMFERFANMTPFQQQMLLMAAGLALQTRTGMDCNIFGGPTQCRAVPAQSSYVQQCGADAQPKVDCLFREATEANLYDSPVDNLEAYLKAKLAQQAQQGMPMMGGKALDDVPALCPQCFSRLQALWCALAVPSCGTFDALVQRGILPALGQAVKAYRSRSSATRAEAVAGAVAAAVHVSGAGLPCAEMCEAVLDTCGGHCEHVMSMAGGKVRQATLGALLQWMAAQPEIRRIGRMPNLGNARAVFKDVWDRPLCSLFPRYNASDSAAGACRLPATVAQSQCTSQKEWCQATSMAAVAKGGDDHPVMYIQALILVQFLRASTGWLTTDDTIIFDIHSSVSEAAAGGAAVSGGTGTDGAMEAAARGAAAGGLSGTQVFGIVVLSIFAFVLLSAGAAMVAMRWWRERGEGRRQVWYAELSDQDADTYPLNNPNDRL